MMSITTVPLLLVLLSLVPSFSTATGLDREGDLIRELKGKGKKAKRKGKGKKDKGSLPVQLGPRPYYLVDSMPDGDLKDDLEYCANNIKYFEKSDWSIGHRGACLQFPEHTIESYTAAVIQGAGIIECDVTFTKDRELICRHSQCDLHTTTNVVATDLNDKCTTPWAPGVTPKCCASDFTLAEIKTLCAKMDYADSSATTAEDYVFGNVAYYRTDLYGRECHAVPTHAESIELGIKHNVKFTPELKSADVAMPYEGDYSQVDYALQMVNEYVQYHVDPARVWPQSFNWDDVNYWVKYTDFYKAVALEGNYALAPADYDAQFAKLDENVMYYAPPMQMLLDLDGDDNIIASELANYVNEMGYYIITWTLERSTPLSVSTGGFYYGSTGQTLMADGDIMKTLYALDKKVGVVGVFSDWPATTTFYANCMGL